MFRNTVQSGLLSILYSLGSKPLHLWERNAGNGRIRRIIDPEIESGALELSGANVKHTFIRCPIGPEKRLGIKLPFLVLIIRNMMRYFMIEVQILDDKNVRRCFRASNYQTIARVTPALCSMPMRLDDGWNQIQLNLNDFTRRAYGTNYVETLRIQIHANCRIRRIFFADRLYPLDDLPPDFKLELAMPFMYKKPEKMCTGITKEEEEWK
ncbi:cilia- and flagella-associated protein 20-like [Scaptodrosophila lebanonensis]|uniref:Cilia- and flagella-associated protein 20-like n=1 Tax=Drosophila lebanonensis TaxID=7225 RepID=A0A6J2TZY4_DROLE|nr:cilia- and flagella-associated protein 20-like [Scaptodrosophila lebanonensis]